MTASKTTPALVGGLFIGVLSALPLVNLGNCCCCLWVVSGGLIAAYLLQSAQPAPIATADAAVAGLLAGAIGAVVASLVAIPVNLLTGPLVQDLLEQFLQSPELPAELREIFEQARQGESGSLAMSVLAGILWLMVSLAVYSVFAMAGGVLGAVLFRKQGTAPVAPPPFVPPASGL